MRASSFLSSAHDEGGYGFTQGDGRENGRGVWNTGTWRGKRVSLWERNNDNEIEYIARK